MVYYGNTLVYAEKTPNISRFKPFLVTLYTFTPSLAGGSENPAEGPRLQEKGISQKIELLFGMRRNNFKKVDIFYKNPLTVYIIGYTIDIERTKGGNER
ncbi:MAG: hypothetical protein AVO34_13435 [Firmicutes bacterium ML8_F2]|jgi:hypothetical protein|nr:MAG: hypothetical protein AVO34_13435 [Firmicutes bacterium ML8_F2]